MSNILEVDEIIPINDNVIYVINWHDLEEAIASHPYKSVWSSLPLLKPKPGFRCVL